MRYSNATGNVLECRELSAGYGQDALVRDVGFEVCPGQIVTLIGPNGAGKSTILKTIAGQLPAMGGAVLLVGKSLKELSLDEQARERSVLLTERLHTELLTCEDVVGMGRYPYTGRMGVLSLADKGVVRVSMELLHVDDLAQQDFMQLSDGQRQRVMLARALCQQPRLLVLDEPTSYLDIRYQVELLGVLRHLVTERELGIVMSLHELSLARQISDWIVCVKDGVVAEQGTPDQVFTRQTIDRLYDLVPGTFDPTSGTVVL